MPESLNDAVNETARPNNQILKALPSAEYRRLVPHLQQVRLRQGDVLHDAGVPVESVYFVTKGVVSLTIIWVIIYLTHTRNISTLTRRAPMRQVCNYLSKHRKALLHEWQQTPEGYKLDA